MKRKWKEAAELHELLKDRNISKSKRHLKCITYAPNIEPHAWIYRYKHTLVALLDQGNGMYNFWSAVSYVDLIEAVVTQIVKITTDYISIKKGIEKKISPKHKRKYAKVIKK